MAVYPCDRHGLRYRGPQRTAYPAIADGGEVKRARRRLCKDCFDDTADWCDSYLGLPEDGGDQSECRTCGSEEDLRSVFVTLYPGGEERRDYYARLCQGCVAGGADMALFGTQASF